MAPSPQLSPLSKKQRKGLSDKGKTCSKTCSSLTLSHLNHFHLPQSQILTTLSGIALLCSSCVPHDASFCLYPRVTSRVKSWKPQVSMLRFCSLSQKRYHRNIFTMVLIFWKEKNNDNGVVTAFKRRRVYKSTPDRPPTLWRHSLLWSHNDNHWPTKMSFTSFSLSLSRKDLYVELEVVDVWFVLNLVVDQLSSPHVSFFYNVLTFWISYLAEIQHGEDKYWT